MISSTYTMRSKTYKMINSTFTMISEIFRMINKTNAITTLYTTSKLIIAWFTSTRESCQSRFQNKPGKWPWLQWLPWLSSLGFQKNCSDVEQPSAWPPHQPHQVNLHLCHHVLHTSGHHELHEKWERGENSIMIQLLSSVPRSSSNPGRLAVD